MKPIAHALRVRVMRPGFNAYHRWARNHIFQHMYFAPFAVKVEKINLPIVNASERDSFNIYRVSALLAKHPIDCAASAAKTEFNFSRLSDNGKRKEYSVRRHVLVKLWIWLNANQLFTVVANLEELHCGYVGWSNANLTGCAYFHVTRKPSEIE